MLLVWIALLLAAALVAATWRPAGAPARCAREPTPRPVVAELRVGESGWVRGGAARYDAFGQLWLRTDVPVSVVRRDDAPVAVLRDLHGYQVQGAPPPGGGQGGVAWLRGSDVAPAVYQRW